MTDLVSVKLVKAWGNHKAGATIEVDQARAEKLRGDGYVAKEPKKGKD